MTSVSADRAAEGGRERYGGRGAAAAAAAVLLLLQLPLPLLLLLLLLSGHCRVFERARGAALLDETESCRRRIESIFAAQPTASSASFGGSETPKV